MMIKVLFALTFLTTILACGKTDPPTPNCSTVTIKAATIETDSLQRYIDSNRIVATKDARGFFYRIDSAATGAKPTVCDSTTVAYKGYLLNGVIFDQNANAKFNLSELITSWQECLPLIGVGGSITVYSPPSLAYGTRAIINNGVTIIPANSYLKFVLTLKAVN